MEHQFTSSFEDVRFFSPNHMLGDRYSNLSGGTMKEVSAKILLFLVSMTVAEPMQFPPGLNKKMEFAELKTGDTVIIKTGPAWLLDKKAHDLFAASIRKQSTIDTLVNAHLNTADSTFTKYHELIKKYEKIDSIQNFIFDSIKTITFKTDSLLTRSRENTNKALGQSYLVSGLLGGIAGFTIPRDQKLWVNGLSAIGGTLAGILVNRIIMK